MAASPRLSESNRLEAFSDGVFAIVLTLLVLDLLPPEHGEDLGDVLGAWPRYLAFLTAFVTVGSIWLTHHNTFSRIRRVDPRVLVLNLGLLFATSLVPWPTALIASALGSGDAGKETAAVLAYSLVTVLTGGSWTALDRYLAHAPRLLESPGDSVWMLRNAWFSVASIGVAAVGAGLAFLLPVAAVVLYLVVPGIFILITLFERDEDGAPQQD